MVDKTMQPTRVSVWLRPTANQAAPMTALAAQTAPAATGLEADQSGAGSGSAHRREGGRRWTRALGLHASPQDVPLADRPCGAT